MRRGRPERSVSARKARFSRESPFEKAASAVVGAAELRSGLAGTLFGVNRSHFPTRFPPDLFDGWVFAELT